MPRDALNPFQPYENLPANHENQLTRALLILLRLCPMAHVTWLRLIDLNRDLAALAPAEFDTQKREIPVGRVGDEGPELVSVFLAPERPLTQGVVRESERSQVLDAIIDYAGNPVVVVENKVVEDSIDQAEHLNTGQQIALEGDQMAVVVRWRDLIESLSNLLEKDLVGGGERVLLGDFLTYVEDHFESLGPYRNLALCQDSALRINRRLRAILAEAAGGDAKIDQYGPTVDFGGQLTTAARAYFTLEANDRLSLSVYPADTLSQAREFYGRQEIVEAVRLLGRSEGWSLRPNFHFGFMQSGYCWTRTTMGVESYLDFWVGQIGNSRMVPRENWDEYWTMLLSNGIASETDLAEFERRFVNTKIAKASPRPGLMLERTWDLSVARSLDSDGELLSQVINSLSSMRSALGIRGGA